MTIVFINGSFGVGKTTVARLLCRRTRSSAIANPEHAGFIVLRLPRWMMLRNQGSGDYQDMPLWRRLTVLTIRLARLRARTVFVPMAFTNLDYLNEIRAAVARFDSDIHHVCLVAPLPVVEGRLRRRNDAPHHLEWQLCRARDCCTAHQDESFAIRIGAATPAPEEIADEIEALLSR
jgi:hypothetical protein